MKKRYCIVGTGGRSEMYIKAILNTFPEQAELVGICDSNQKRMDYYNKILDGSECVLCNHLPLFICHLKAVDCQQRIKMYRKCHP